MADSMNKELFLDILTKDEREALLTKKMEEIRKKNEALRKRHEEIEADKRVAAKESPSVDVNSYNRDPVHSGPASPRKESKPLPGDEKRGPRPPKSSGRGRSQGRDKPKEKRPQGPPPDPSYNFLVDRRREGGSGGKDSPSFQDHPGDRSPRKGESRRHPKNYGGPDFNNVKAQLRTSKERQERPKSGPPRTKMELAMSMTGRERKQYMEWKAERERVDLERLERQKSNTGEWRRAWDADKHQQDFEQPSSPQRTEPAKRPAGRIGSGRFDRGEREERHRGDTPRQKAGVKVDPETQQKPVGRGRARGRGRGRGRGERSPRQRTTSSGDESRKVERQKDLLVVKIDNSGKDSDHTVEVEYWDDDGNDVKSNSATSVRSGASHSSHSNSRARRHEDNQFEDPEEGQDGGYVGSHRRHTHSQSLGDENEHDESWEDCPEDAEFYADDYTDGDDKYNEPLKLECKLNPDAPEFTPTSPDFMKTPPGHVKVMDWVTEVNSNLSPTSPPPTMGEVNNEECKKTLFKKDSPKKSDKEQQSSNGGVTDTSKETLEEVTISSNTEDKGPSVAAAPEAADEFLDASGDLEEEGMEENEALTDEQSQDIVKKPQEQHEEADSQPDVVQHETCSNENEEKVNATEEVVIVDEKGTNDKEKKLEDNKSLTDNVGTKTVLTDKGMTENCFPQDDTNTAEVPSCGEGTKDAEIATQEQSAQPSSEVQMAKSDPSSQGELVDSVQDRQLVQEAADPTGHEKSSLSETETVESTDPAPTSTSKEPAADSNVG